MAEMAKTMSTQNVVKSSVDEITEVVKSASHKGLPPVHSWNPPFCGNLDMVICKDGTWLHEGSPIKRPEMVKLFSSILRRDDDDYFLVTPVEKVGITVENAPFVAVGFEVTEDDDPATLTFETHVGDIVDAGPDHPIRVEIDPATQEPAPYVLVRDRLEALIDRKTFYRLMERCEEKDGWFGVSSNGVFFPLIEATEL